MFDFRKYVRHRHPIIARPLHDEFNADHGDNNDVLVTSGRGPDCSVKSLLKLPATETTGVIRRRAMH
jgi:hypothetical protein